MKQDVLGLQFDNVTMDEAVARAEELLEAPGASIVVTPNAEIGYEALHDAHYEGWFIVEAEQDPAKANPLEYAKMAREYIKKTAGI